MELFQIVTYDDALFRGGARGTGTVGYSRFKPIVEGERSLGVTPGLPAPLDGFDLTEEMAMEPIAVQRWIGRGLGLAGMGMGLGMGMAVAIAPPASAEEVAVTPTQDDSLTLPSRADITQLPQANKFPLPATRISQDAQIYLVNYTNATIDYAVLGRTGEQLLSGLLAAPEQSVAELPKLPLPLNLSLGRQDNGFMLVRPLIKNGDLYLTIDFAPSLQLDTNYININEKGEVYLY